MDTVGQSLCGLCSSVDLASIYARAIKIRSKDHESSNFHRRLPANRGRQRRLQVGNILNSIENRSRCLLCRFFIDCYRLSNPFSAQTILADLKPVKHGIHLVIDSLPWFHNAGIASDLDSCPFAWLQFGSDTTTGEPFLCVSFEPISPKTRQPEQVAETLYPRVRPNLNAFNGTLEAELVKQWINKCSSCHGEPCSLVKIPQVPGLKLINVLDRTIVSYTPGDRYVALSYVWGQDQDERVHFQNSLASLRRKEGSPLRLPRGLPQTCEDALKFVRGIGETFVWIDLICIDHGDAEEKQKQINCMDQVFASAWLVLLSLDGKTSNSGLPGISKPLLRTDQPTVTLSSGRLTTTYVDYFWGHSGKSVWDSRAWTLQERVLARRYIVFADSYVAMTCAQGEVFHEAVQVVDTACKIRTWTDESGYREDGSMIDLDLESWSFKIYNDFVYVFTGRQITIEDDMQNACRGALNRISQNTGCHFCFGIPDKNRHAALLWQPHEQSLLTRRKAFPSWSWLGWIGRSECAYWLEYQSVPYSDTDHLPRHIKEAIDALSRGRKKRRLHHMLGAIDLTQADIEMGGVTPDGRPCLKLTTTTAKCDLVRVREHGTAFKHSRHGVQRQRTAIGDHCTLLDPGDRFKKSKLTSRVGEFEVFIPVDYLFRVDHAVFEELSTTSSAQISLALISYWPRIWDSVKTLTDLVSVLVLVENDDGTFWRLASTVVPLETWEAFRPTPRHEVVVV